MTGNSSAPASSSATTDNKTQSPVTPEAAHATPVDGTGASPGVNFVPATSRPIARYHQVVADPATLAHRLGLSTSEAARGQAHPRQRGALGAHPAVVTAFAVTDEKKGSYYPAILPLGQKDVIIIDGKRIPWSPGTNITAEIKTGKRRVIEYLLSPVQRAGSESLRER